MKQHIVRIVLGLAITLFFIGHAARYYEVPIITQLDNIIYDARLQVTMPRGVDERIVILDIDEKSLQEVGRWPWPRDLLAGLVEKLFDKYQVAIVAFDVVFAEADHSSGIRALERLAEGPLKDVPAFQQAFRELRPTLDNDGLFARAISGKPVVLGYYLNSDKGAKRIAAIPDPVLPKGTFQGRNIPFTTWEGYGGNLPQLLDSAASAGHFNPITDPDGVVRRVPMIAELDGAYYEALSLAVVRTILGFPKVEPGYAPDRFTPDGDGGRAAGDGPYALYVGNVMPHKNLLRLVDAFALANCPGLRLVIRGHGRAAPVRALRERIARQGLAAREAEPPGRVVHQQRRHRAELRAHRHVHEHARRGRRPRARPVAATRHRAG